MNTQKIKHVIIFASDAFGSHLIDNNKLPTLQKIMASGAYTLNNHALIPTVSSNNWISLMCGLSTNLHGFTRWNSTVPEIKNHDFSLVSIFKLIKAKNKNAKTCAFFRWPHWQHIIELEMLDYYYNPILELDIENWNKTPNSTIVKNKSNVEVNDLVVKNALKYIKKEKPYCSLIYVNEPDTTGHEIGHDSNTIKDVAKKVDYWVSEVLDVINNDPEMKDNTLFVFLADHGGQGMGAECHGSISKEEFKVPIMFYGSMVNKLELDFPIIQYDVTKTLAWALELSIPQLWNGKILSSVFKNYENRSSGLIVYQREIGTYGIYHDGLNLALILGYNETMLFVGDYAKKADIKACHFYDLEYNMTKIDF